MSHSTWGTLFGTTSPMFVFYSVAFLHSGASDAYIHSTCQLHTWAILPSGHLHLSFVYWAEGTNHRYHVSCWRQLSSFQAYYNWAIAISDRAKIRGRTKEAEDLWKQVHKVNLPYIGICSPTRDASRKVSLKFWVLCSYVTTASLWSCFYLSQDLFVMC